MKECDNSKIHISSSFILSICLLKVLDTFITRTITTLQHFATLHHSSPNYTSLHLSTLHFLSFTLHYPLIWLNPFTFPTALFHLTSLNYPQYSSPISKLISKIMNLKETLTISLHFPSLFIFLVFLLLSYQPFPLLKICDLYLLTTTTRPAL